MSNRRRIPNRRRIRILWHSVAPWVKTGYGRQTATWVPRIASLGYDVGISCYAGLSGGPTEWRGFMCYPGGEHKQGADVVAMHAGHFDADLVISLLDTWALGADALKMVPSACWSPLDSEPTEWSEHRMPGGDLKVFKETGSTPIAVTRWGQQMMLDSGFANALYVPHGIDTNTYSPFPHRKELREAMGVDDSFMIGTFAANLDGARKGWPEQMWAIGQLARKHKDVLYLAHTMNYHVNAFNIEWLAEDMGVPKSQFKMSAQYLQAAGLIADSDMAGTMGACDLGSQVAWAEGCGLPILELQSCGTPVVAGNSTAMRETAAPGWLVDGDEYYVPGHRAQWIRPRKEAILAAYEEAYQKGAVYRSKQLASRPHAMQYDASRVLKNHWEPALRALIQQWL